MTVVTDSIACLTRDLLEEYGVGIIPLNFYASGRIYKDGVDITPSEAYDLFLSDPEAFKTSGRLHPQTAWRSIVKPAGALIISCVSPCQPDLA